MWVISEAASLCEMSVLYWGAALINLKKAWNLNFLLKDVHVYIRNVYMEVGYEISTITPLHSEALTYFFVFHVGLDCNSLVTHNPAWNS